MRGPEIEKANQKKAPNARSFSLCLFATERVLEATDRVLNLPGNLVALAFGLELGITGDLADDFLHSTLGLLCRSLDAIFDHVVSQGFFVGRRSNWTRPSRSESRRLLAHDIASCEA